MIGNVFSPKHLFVLCCSITFFLIFLSRNNYAETIRSKMLLLPMFLLYGHESLLDWMSWLVCWWLVGWLVCFVEQCCVWRINAWLAAPPQNKGYPPSPDSLSIQWRTIQLAAVDSEWSNTLHITVAAQGDQWQSLVSVAMGINQTKPEQKYDSVPKHLVQGGASMLSSRLFH